MAVEIWPPPLGIVTTGEILFTYDVVKISRRSLRGRIPRRISVRYRTVRP